MADAIPVSGKRKAVKQADPVPETLEPVPAALADIPEQYREAAEAAFKAGKRVSIRPKGGLIIFS